MNAENIKLRGIRQTQRAGTLTLVMKIAKPIEAENSRLQKLTRAQLPSTDKVSVIKMYNKCTNRINSRDLLCHI